MKMYQILSLLIMALLSQQGSSVVFNRKSTGVDFSVYVKKSENGGPIPGWKSYSMADVKTMLEVISGKFSRVATYGVGADNVPFHPNKTYSESNAQAMTSEAAALINSERETKTLTILAGIWESDVKQQMETEVKVALESAKKANSIYPGTVEGLVLSHHEIGVRLPRTEQTLELIRRIKNEAQKLGLTIGTRQKCYGLYAEIPDGDTESGKLLELRQKIVAESDFIICEAEPGSHSVMSGADDAFITVGNDLINFREDFRKLNPDIEVMGQTKWPSKGDNAWENVENMRDYWVVVDKWATENNFPMFLFEAMDNPWKMWSKKESHYGWWKLKSNNLADKKYGYVEKITEAEEDEENESITDQLNKAVKWIHVYLFIGTVLTFFLVCAIFMLYLKVRELQDDLAKQKLVREQYLGIVQNDCDYKFSVDEKAGICSKEAKY